MITKKQFMILFCVFLFAVVAYQTQPVEAFDNEYNDQYIAIGNSFERWIALDAGDVISGYFETDEETKGIDFFIADDANFLIWDGGGTGSTGYEINTNMHTLGFEFTVPYADDWWVVFSNVAGSSNVWVDIAIDINGDTTPFYSTSTYDYTGYAEVLEMEEYAFLSLSLAEGTVIDGEFETWFVTDGLDFFICDAANFDDWENGYSATAYSIEANMHFAYIDTYTIPTSGTWYLVFWNTGQTDTVTYSYGIEIDTTDAVEPLGVTWISIVGVVVGIILLIICCRLCRGKKKDPSPTPTTVDHYVAPPSRPAPTTTVREREIVSERVLVICPYCGAKNEQGVLSCHNCDAEL